MRSEQPMTGTRRRPIERIPADPTSMVDWLVLLAGPAIWITHFMVVYLAAEAACVPTRADQYKVIGSGALVILTVIATVIAAVACTGVAWAARSRKISRDGEGHRSYAADMARAGYLLAVGAFLGVVSVGLPVLYLSPLC